MTLAHAMRQLLWRDEVDRLILEAESRDAIAPTPQQEKAEDAPAVEE